MISDEDVRLSFQEKLNVPDIYANLKAAQTNPTPGYRLANNFILQVFRGQPSHLWKDAHPLGCTRQKAIVQTFGIIPKYCFDCFKILVTPRTVVELFKLLMVFEKITLPDDNTRKCMTERRDYCSGAYKGFVYTRGMDEAKMVNKLVREAVSDSISPEVPVSLKRGCSEFAEVHPDYARINQGVAVMKYHKEWQYYEDFAEANFIADESMYTPDLTSDEKATNPSWEIFAMHYWLKYAATIGDKSYLTISGKALTPLPDLKRPPFAAAPPLAIFR